MMIFNLPDLGEGLAEAEVREWYVKEGDTVKLDQPLLSVETAKALVDVPSPYNGRIAKLYAKAHEVIKTHAPLVEFEGAGAEESPSPTKDKGSIVGKLEESQAPILEDAVRIGAPATAASALKVLPMVKALAKQLKVDLNAITPTGPKGQITAEDVKRQASVLGKTKSLGKGEALHGVRRAMAMTMAKAHEEVAQLTLIDDVDIGHLALDADITVMVLQAMAAAIKVEPALNAWFDGKALERQLLTEVNIGLAMDSAEGLFVPVLKDVDQGSSEQLRESINRFKESVRNRTILPSDMQGATITLTNFGTLAGKYASPIVVPPMVAILGCGRIHEAVVVREGQIMASRLLPLSLSADHRAVTGGEAARFLAAVKQYLEKQ